MIFEKGPFFNKYVQGFGDGEIDFIEKIHTSDSTILDKPTQDVTDIYSIGYYDGYCYYLEKYQQGINPLLMNGMMEQEASSYFSQAQKKFQSASLENTDTKIR